MSFSFKPELNTCPRADRLLRLRLARYRAIMDKRLAQCSAS